MAIDYDYKSAADYYRDAGEEAQLKAMKDCGLIDDDDDGEDVLYYSNANKFDPYEKTLHIDYGFTYDDPDDERIRFPDGEEFDILDVVDDQSFWDKYDKIFEEREQEKTIEAINERRKNMPTLDEQQKALMESAKALLNSKMAELSGGNPAVNNASGKRTIIANIVNEIKAENPALAYNTIDKMAQPGKRRIPAIDLVKRRAEEIYNAGFTSLADYQKANGINMTGTSVDIATPNAPINTAVGTIIPGGQGGMKVVTPNMKPNTTENVTPKPVSVNVNTTQPAQTQGLGTGLNPALRNKMVGSIDLKTFASTLAAQNKAPAVEQPVQTPVTPTATPAPNVVTNASVNINTATSHTVPEVTQPITQPILNQDAAAIEAKENIDLDNHIESIKNIFNREAIKTPENHMEMLQKHGYVKEEQNKKVFKEISVGNIINNRKELDTPRLAAARMSYRKLEKDLAICVLDSGIPADKIDILMELFNAIGVGESFALAVEQVANERSNSNQPLIGELKSLYNPHDLSYRVHNLTEVTEPVLSTEANRIMSVGSPETFAFASVKKSQVLDLLDFINKNGIFTSFTDDEARTAYSDLATSCLYNKFDVRSYENWKSIIYYIVSVLGIKDTLIREYYISAFGDVPENDKNNLGGIMNNQTFRPVFNGASTATPGMITTPTTQPNQQTTTQDINLATTLAGLQSMQPAPSTVTTQANPMTGAQVVQPVQNVGVMPGQQIAGATPIMQPNTMAQTQVAQPNMMQQAGTTQVTPNTPRPISTMPMNIQTGTLYGGQTPTVPAGVGSLMNNVQTQPNMYAQPNNMVQPQNTQYVQPNTVQQPMIASPNGYVQPNQYTQPIITAPAVGANTMMNINANNNMMGGMNQMNGMMMNNGMNMMNTQMNMGMNNMARPMAPTMPITPVNGMGMNQMVGMNPMMNMNPMMGYNPMMQNQMNMMNPMNPMMNRQMVPQMNMVQNPMMMNMNNGMNMMGYNPMMRTPMMNTQVNPMMSNPMMMQNPMMNMNMNPMMQNQQMMYNPMMPRPLGTTPMNPMMNTAAGYNQNTIYNRMNPMMMQPNMGYNPMMNTQVNPMMNNGMNMMGQMTGATNPMMNPNPMMNNQMNMGMAPNMMQNQQMMNPMMGYGYGYNGYMGF